MADKTTTLKTKTNDNVYPNVIGDNRDNAIVNSAHIKHTLTKDHKINFRLDDNVSNLIFNSLQKPAGLTKTKLVGVGTNGQENIEIGDNLTLANGKLSATGGGSGGDAFDVITLSEDETTYTGTITGTKPILLSRYGSLFLYNSTIVGDVAIINMLYNSGSSFTFSENTLLNGKIESTQYEIQSQIYSHFITLISPTLGNICFNFNSLFKQKFTIETFIEHFSEHRVSCSGFINYNGIRKIAQYVIGLNDHILVYFYDLSDGSIGSIRIDNTFSISDISIPVY